MSILVIVLLVVLVLAVGGGFGYPRYSYPAFGPLGLVLVIVLALWLLGVLR